MKTKILIILFLALNSLYSEGEKNALSSPTDSRNWHLSVDFLYWKAHENRLDYGTHPLNLFQTADFNKGKSIEPHFQWNTGFREKFAYSPEERKWDLYVQWTHIDNKATGSITASQGVNPQDAKAFFPIWHLSSDALSTDYVFKAVDNWKVSLNVLETSGGYHFDFCKWLRFTTRTGARYATLKQHTHLTYYGGIFPDNQESTVMNNNYWGVGPMIQLDTEFYFGRGHHWSIFLSAAGSMYLGKNNIKQFSETYFINNHFRYREQAFKVRWEADFISGLRYMIPFALGKYAFTFKAGWEFHDFFNQNNLKQPSIYKLKGNRDLYFMGWFISSQFDF